MRIEPLHRLPYGRRLVVALGQILCCSLVVAGAACDRYSDPFLAFEQGQYEQAGKLLLPRAEQGDAIAQNYLGVMYFAGFGVERDMAVAGRWFGRAAVLGNSAAQRNLGLLFEQGLGLPRDTMRAIGWYLRSGKSGNTRAFEALKTMGSEVTTNLAHQGETIVNADIAAGTVSTR